MAEKETVIGLCLLGDKCLKCFDSGRVCEEGGVGMHWLFCKLTKALTPKWNSLGSQAMSWRYWWIKVTTWPKDFLFHKQTKTPTQFNLLTHTQPFNVTDSIYCFNKYLIWWINIFANRSHKLTSDLSILAFPHFTSTILNLYLSENLTLAL